MVNWTRRHFVTAALALPAAAWFTSYKAMAAPFTGTVKITAIKCLQLDNLSGGCLIRIETDAGLIGYGEAGSTADAARARIKGFEQFLIGQDPLAIARHFSLMTSQQHNFKAHIPTISGVDIALWDLTGKILDKPLFKLLGGPLRPAAPVYSHGMVKNMLDETEVRDWAAKVKSAPEGFDTFKFGYVGVDRHDRAPYVQTLDQSVFNKNAKAFALARAALGDDFQLAMHCLGEFDTRSAIGLSRAIEPIHPTWIEDPLNIEYSEGWVELKRSTTVPVLTGEKIEMVSGFRPFLDNGVVDIIHPDPSFAGGITGVRQIADYAQLSRTPVGLHSGPCSLVHFYASVHLSGAIENFFKIENALGSFRGFIETMAAGNQPQIRNGVMQFPTGPGLGLDLNEDYLKKHMTKGETWWG
jgi:L-alanine-DL-glutamate epimerase-like enolase superfamily enzyme